jgi:hypothetical protein
MGFRLLFWLLWLLVSSRREQILQLLALRQQLEVYQRQVGRRRLRLTEPDRRFWVELRHCWWG